MSTPAIKIEDVIRFFGHTSDAGAFDAYLNSVDIAERPAFEENPSEWVERPANGVILIFNARHNYERLIGPASGQGSMVFGALRVYGTHNASGYTMYPFPLPGNFSFDLKQEQVTALFGAPSFDDEAADDEDRLLTWNGLAFAGGKYDLSVVFSPHGGSVSFFTIKPVKVK
jgi:hypothetical protein